MESWHIGNDLADLDLEKLSSYISELSAKLVEAPTSPVARQGLKELFLLLSKLEPAEELKVLSKIENTLILRELSRRKKDQTEVVLTPRQERMIEGTIEYDSEHNIGMAVFYGPPGTGKTSLAIELARRFTQVKPDAPGFIQLVTADTITPFSQEFVTTSSDSNGQYFYTLLEKRAESLGELDLLKSIIKHEVLPYLTISSVEQRTEIVNRFLTQMGVGNTVKYNGNEIVALDSSNDVPTIRPAIDHFISQGVHTEESFAINQVTPGRLHKIVTLGGVVIIDEFDIQGMVLQTAGQNGAEQMMEPKTQLDGRWVVTMTNGEIVSFPKSTRFILTTNDIHSISPKVVRRFADKELKPSSSDLIFIARTLLSDADGNCVLSKSGREVEEHQFCILLQIWNRLSHQNSKAFSTEALSKMCRALKQGMSLELTLNYLIESSPSLSILINSLMKRLDFTPPEDGVLLTLPQLNARAIVRDSVADITMPDLTGSEAKQLLHREVQTTPISIKQDSIRETIGINVVGHAISEAISYDELPGEPLTGNDRLALSHSGEVMLSLRKTQKDGFSLSADDIFTGNHLDMTNADLPKSKTEIRTFEVPGQLAAMEWVTNNRALIAVIEQHTPDSPQYLRLIAVNRSSISEKQNGSTHERTELNVQELKRRKLPEDFVATAVIITPQGLLELQNSNGRSRVYQLSSLPSPMLPLPLVYSS